MTGAEERQMAALLAPYRAVEPSERLVSATLAAESRRRLRRPALAVAVAVGALGVVAAAPAGRSAFQSVADLLMDRLSDETPGPTVVAGRGGDRLNYLDAIVPGSATVLARSGRYRLVAFRRSADEICLSLGTSTSQCRSTDAWLERLAGPRALPLETTLVRGGTALWGLVGHPDLRVTVRYRGGSPTTAAVGAGGFVAIVERGRQPTTLDVADATGSVIESVPLGGFAWAVCDDPAGCVGRDAVR